MRYRERRNSFKLKNLVAILKIYLKYYNINRKSRCNSFEQRRKSFKNYDIAARYNQRKYREEL